MLPIIAAYNHAVALHIATERSIPRPKTAKADKPRLEYARGDYLERAGRWVSAQLVMDTYGHLEQSRVDQIVTGVKLTTDTKLTNPFVQGTETGRQTKPIKSGTS